MNRKEITKIKIMNSLINLMEEKSFDKISVLDIITNIEINRGTFYLHFFDKYDLLEQIENEIFDDLNKCLTNPLFNKLIYQVSTMNSLNQNDEMNEKLYNHIKLFITNVYLAIDKHAHVIKILLSKNGGLSTSHKIMNFFKNTFTNNIEAILKNKTTTIPKEYVLAIATNVHYSLVIEWINKKQRETPQELAEIALSIIFPVIQQVLFKKSDSSSQLKNQF